MAQEQDIYVPLSELGGGDDTIEVSLDDLFPSQASQPARMQSPAGAERSTRPKPIEAQGFTHPESVRVSNAETTTLGPDEEPRFQSWVKKNQITDVDQPGSFYDYRGYWKEHGDKPIKFGEDHFTDTYKQHGHPTFSVESKYSKGDDDGGRWEGETFIPSKADQNKGTFNTKTGQWSHASPIWQPNAATDTLEGIVTAPVRGAQEYAAAIQKEAATPLEPEQPGAYFNPKTGQRTSVRGPESLKRAAGYAHEIAGAGFTASEPLIAAAAIANPAATVIGLGAAGVAQKTVELAGKALDVDPRLTGFAGDLAAIFAAHQAVGAYEGRGAKAAETAKAVEADATARAKAAAVLGIDPNAAPADVRSAYLQKVKENHPDVNPDADPSAMADINLAGQWMLDHPATGQPAGTSTFAAWVKSSKEWLKSVGTAAAEATRAPQEAPSPARAVGDRTLTGRVEAPVEAQATTEVPVEDLKPVVEKLKDDLRKAHREAETDELTGVANRRALNRALPAAEKDPATAVVVFDANNFGQVNKKVGQEAGDDMLKGVASAIQQAAQEHGVGERVFRRGGDEFVVLAPKDIADKVRARAEELFGEQQAGDVTVSLTGNAGNTFKEADATLQAAKAARKAAQEAPVEVPVEEVKPVEEPPAPVPTNGMPEPTDIGQGVKVSVDQEFKTADGRQWVVKAIEKGKGIQIEALQKTGTGKNRQLETRWVSDSEFRVVHGEHIAGLESGYQDLLDENKYLDERTDKDDADLLLAAEKVATESPAFIRKIPDVELERYLDRAQELIATKDSDMTEKDIERAQAFLPRLEREAVRRSDVRQGQGGLQLEGEPTQEAPKPAAEPPKPAGKRGLGLKGQKPAAEPAIWKELGTNKNGHPVFEDQRGVRSYTEGGMRFTEPVGIVPGGGITTAKYRKEPGGDYHVVTPVGAAKPAKQSQAVKNAIAKLGQARFDQEVDLQLKEIGDLAYTREEAMEDIAALANEGSMDEGPDNHGPISGVKAEDIGETMPPEDVLPAPEKMVSAKKLAGDQKIALSEAQKRLQEWKDEAARIGREEDHSNEVVFSLFDRTGEWSKPYRDAGYDVVQYDIANGDDLVEFMPTADIMLAKSHGKVIVGVLAAPPCTSFAVSGARWWEDQHDKADVAMVEKKYGFTASKYFDTPLDYANTLVKITEAFIEMANPTQFHAMENPVGRIAEQNDLPKPLLAFDPNNFGDPYTKKTFLWGSFNPNLPTANVEPTKGSYIHTLRGDNPAQKAERSTTPEGFAYAFFMANHQAPVGLPVAEEGRKVETSGEAPTETNRVDTGQPPVPRGATVDATRAGGEGALEAVPAEPGEGTGVTGPGGAGPRHPEGVPPDRVPHAARADAEPESPSIGSGGAVQESVADSPSGATHDPGDRPGHYFLSDERIAAIIKRGNVTRAKDNLAAIDLIKKLTAEKRYATPTEQDVLAKYVGWGASDLAALLGDSPQHGWSGTERQLWEDIHSKLTKEEIAALTRSTLNAHFTYDLYKPIWEALEDAGFTGGRVLEPAVGTGHAFGFMPPNVAAASTLSASELEPLTAAIAHNLYPQAKIQPVGYEEAKIPRGTQDLVISNVPFGDFGVRDPLMPSFITDRIHNYFFAKALEHVRPGGLVVFVTSRYTMDAQAATKVRSYIAERAEFLGAIRLPNSAFDKSAKTEVVTDLIVLRRLAEGQVTSAETMKQFVETKKVEALSSKTTSGWGRRQQTRENNVYRSTWYDAHPELVLGEESTEGTQYGPGQYTVTAKDADVAGALGKALTQILYPGSYTPAARATQRAQAAAAQTVTGNYNPGELRVGEKEGRVGDAGLIVKVGLDGTVTDVTPKKRDGSVDMKAVQRLRGMVGVRDALRSTVRTMRDKEATDEAVSGAQEALKRTYNAFYRAYGRLNDRANRMLFKDDPESTNLLGLEVISRKTKITTDKNGAEVLKLQFVVTGLADIFEKRTLHPNVAITHADTPKDALYASLGVHGRLDWPWMAEIAGVPVESLQQALTAEGLTFEHPDGSVILAEEYLSGDVVSKLEDVAAASDQKRYETNRRALEAVKPALKTREDVEGGQVSIGLGSHWVPAEDLGGFVAEQLHTSPESVSYKLEGTSTIVRWEQQYSQNAAFAAARHALAVRYNSDQSVYTFTDLIDDTINLRTPQLGHWEGSGRDRYFVREPEAELAARANQDVVRDAWVQYVYQHPEAMGRLLDIFNKRFNRTVERTYDGAHLTYPDMATLTDDKGNVLSFYAHQNNVVARILSTGNTLMAHEVGAGKTFAMIAAAMKMRQTGRARKPMITVPTYLLRQWANDISRLYPTARILAFDEKDLASDKRQTAMARIAFGDWDIVLTPHSSFELLRTDPARVIGMLEHWVNELKAAEGEADEEGDNVKAMERRRRHLEDKIDKLKDRLTEAVTKGGDRALVWEDLGVDALFVDEAHSFKNLFFFTKMDNLRGLSKSEADKSLDLYMKIQEINESSNYRNLVLATATPVMNSIVEIYTMQRYLQPQTLDQYGLQAFDNWYGMFGRAVPTTESRPDGTYHEVMRLREYNNLQLLSKLVRQVMDYVPWEAMPYLKLPKLRGGKIEVIETEPHPLYARLQEWFGERLAAIKANPPHVDQQKNYIAPERLDPLTGAEMGKKDNILTVMTDAKKAAVDVRLVLGDRAKDWPGSRMNKAADELVKEWKDSTPKKGVVLVFMDQGTPSGKAGRLEFLGKNIKVEDETEGELDEPTEAGTEEGPAIQDESGFINLYDDLKAKLVKRGVPSAQIAYIHQANSSAERLALFDAANAGDVRFVFASTDKGGIGMNIQTRLVAEFEIDPPRYGRPGDLRQRMGRIIRQGNTYPEVRMSRFVTRGTADEWTWGLITSKDYQTRQFLLGNASTMTEDDPSTMSLEEAQMRASGDQRVIELTDLRGKLARIEAQAAAAERAVAAAKADVSIGTERQRHLKRDLADLEKWTKEKYSSQRGDNFSMMVGTTKYTKRDQANAALLKVLQPIADFGNTAGVEVAHIGDRPIVARSTSQRYKKEVRDSKDRVVDHVDVVEKRVALSIGASDIGAEDEAITTVKQENPDKPETLGAGQDVIASVVNTYEAIPKHANGLKMDIEKNISRVEQGNRVLENPPGVIDTLKKTRERIARLEAELVSDSKAKEAAALAAKQAKETPPEPPKEGGGTTLQATILPGAKEFAEHVVEPAVKALAEVLAKQKGELQILFAPGSMPAAVTGAGVMRSNLAARAQRIQRMQRLLADTKKEMDKWSHGDSMEFWDVMEGLKPPSTLTADRRALATEFRRILDVKRDAVLKRGLLKNYLENYWSHEWQRGGPVEQAIKRLFGKRPLQGPESYRKKRTIPTMRAGLDMGLEPVSWNPAEQLMRKMVEMEKSITAYDIKRELKRLGEAKFIAAGKKLPPGWRYFPDSFGLVYGPPTTTTPTGEEVKIAFGRLVAGRYAGPSDVVRLLENHLSPGLRGRSALFDMYRVAGNFLNQIQLGLSAFHATMVGMESVVSKQSLVFEQIARGQFKEAARSQAQVPVAPFLDFQRGHKGLKALYEKDANAAIIDGIIGQVIQGGGGFGWDLFEHSGAPAAFMAALRSAGGAVRRGDVVTAAKETGRAGLLTVPALIEAQAKPLMEGWVPRLKLAAYLDLAAMELKTLGPSPDLQEVRRVLGKAWDSIDNRFGQLRYDNLFWHNALKDVGMGSLRALGWNVGTVREMFGVLPAQMRQIGLTGDKGIGQPPTRKVSVGKGKGYEERNESRLHRKMAWFLASVLVYGLAGAIYMYLKTGKRPETLKDYFFPQNGEVDSNGRQQRVSIPGYFKDLYAVTHAFPGSLVESAAHKLNPMLIMISELLGNEDFFGTQIRNPEDPWIQQLQEAMQYVIDEYQPISIQNMMERGGRVGALESFAGIAPAPKSVSQTPLEAYLQKIAPPLHRTKEQTERALARRSIREALRSKDPEQVKAALQGQALGQPDQALKSALQSMQKTTVQKMFQEVSVTQALHAWEVASPDERGQLMPAFLAKMQKIGQEADQARRMALVKRFKAAMQLPRPGFTPAREPAGVLQ